MAIFNIHGVSIEHETDTYAIYLPQDCTPVKLHYREFSITDVFVENNQDCSLNDLIIALNEMKQIACLPTELLEGDDYIIVTHNNEPIERQKEVTKSTIEFADKLLDALKS